MQNLHGMDNLQGCTPDIDPIIPSPVILDIFNRGSRVFALFYVREDKRHWIPDYYCRE